LRTRIWFTADDLARISLVATLGPLAETLFSIRAMRARHLTPWRQTVTPRAQAALLDVAALYPARGPFLDLVSSVGPSEDMAHAVERVRAVPHAVLRHEVEWFATMSGNLPPLVAPLLERDPRGLVHLLNALTAYHDAAVAPSWPRIRDQLQREQQRWAHALVSGGVEHLLRSLGSPYLGWNAPVLEIWDPYTTHRADHDYFLRGRGLTLVPSLFFCLCPTLMTDLSRDVPDILVYPLPRGDAASVWSQPSHDLDHVRALLGRSRTRVLQAAASGASTTELAHRARVSVSSASEHASVLRAAGLLTTRRSGASAHHHITTMGVELLRRGAGSESLTPESARAER
jgi:DNA-binding transcriptional ArsR family regulator